MLQKCILKKCEQINSQSGLTYLSCCFCRGFCADFWRSPEIGECWSDESRYILELPQSDQGFFLTPGPHCLQTQQMMIIAGIILNYVHVLSKLIGSNDYIKVLRVLKGTHECMCYKIVEEYSSDALLKSLQNQTQITNKLHYALLSYNLCEIMFFMIQLAFPHMTLLLNIKQTTEYFLSVKLIVYVLLAKYAMGNP